jgi:hypothetical protein
MIASAIPMATHKICFLKVLRSGSPKNVALYTSTQPITASTMAVPKKFRSILGVVRSLKIIVSTGAASPLP